MLDFIKAIWAVKEIKGAILAAGGAAVSAVLTNVVPSLQDSSPITAVVIAAIASTALNIIQRQALPSTTK